MSVTLCALLILLLPSVSVPVFVRDEVRNGIQAEVEATNREPATEWEIEFKVLTSGSGKAKDGSSFSFTVYKSSDGVGVLQKVETYDSPFRAKRNFQRRVKTAVKIMKRETILTKKRQQLGERVVAMLPPAEGQKRLAAVLWTDRSRIHYVESPSLRHALEFEKKFYRRASP